MVKAKLTSLLALGLFVAAPTVASAEEPAVVSGSASSSGAGASSSRDRSLREDKTKILGAEVTRIASSFEDDDIFDIHFGVEYDYNFKRAAILREWNSGSSTDQQNQLVYDLIYRQQRHTLTPTLEIGLWHDLAVYLQLPVVLSDTRDYAFDQRADDCVFGNQPNATCVDRDNSTTIRDQIIPPGGVDATADAAPFSQYTGNTELIFLGPVRRGLDQLHVGLKYGILNQSKRSHMPDWIIAAEGRFAVGKPMTFSRRIEEDPSGNHRVGRRIHELGVWTALSRRYRFLGPFFNAFWRQSLRATGSKFEDFSEFGNQGDILPQSTTGMTFGTELVPFERKSRNIKVALEASGSATLHYNGRGYSEVWELLADSPALVGSFDPTQSASCDRSAALAFAATAPGDRGYLQAGGASCQQFQGITELQDYGSFGFTGALNFHLSEYFRLRLGSNFSTDTRHFVTNASRGDASGGSDNDRVEPGTREVNPMRRDVVDNVGRRYVVDDVIDFHVFLRLFATF